MRLLDGLSKTMNFRYSEGNPSEHPVFYVENVHKDEHLIKKSISYIWSEIFFWFLRFPVIQTTN